ncbi:serine-threonine/tyrosine-protein kinase catalytic domain-containing protein [Tanacetum coccineum]
MPASKIVECPTYSRTASSCSTVSSYLTKENRQVQSHQGECDQQLAGVGGRHPSQILQVQERSQGRYQGVAVLEGHGGFDKVYKGTISNGESRLVVAIKRLDSTSNQGAEEFWAEVEMLSKLRQCHLNEMFLVYEYMLRGILEDHLH